MAKHPVPVHGRDFKPAKDILVANWLGVIEHGFQRDGHGKAFGTCGGIKKTFAYYGNLSTRFLPDPGRSYDEDEDAAGRQKCLDRPEGRPRNEFPDAAGKRNYRKIEGTRGALMKERLVNVLGGPADFSIGKHYKFGSAARRQLTESVSAAEPNG